MDKKIIRKFSNQDGKLHGWAIFCPACQCSHLFDSRWVFNGNHEKPTLKPSMLVHENKDYRKSSNDKHGHRCHSFVTDGKIKYLNDCTHDMRGKTVELESF